VRSAAAVERGSAGRRSADPLGAERAPTGGPLAGWPCYGGP
jgi:hypothetical protein